MRITVVRVFLLACVAALLVVPSASGAFVATAEDAEGDQPVGGRDITQAFVAYSKSGRIAAEVTMRENGGDDVRVGVVIAKAGPQGCTELPALGLPGLAIGGAFATRNGLWAMQLSEGGETKEGAAQWVSGSTPQVARFSAQTPEIAGLTPDCMAAITSDATQPFRDFAAAYDVVGPVPLRAVPELKAEFGKLPVLRPGKARRVRVTISNPGDAATGRLRVKAARLRGLTVRVPRSVPSIAPGAQRSVTVSVTASARVRSGVPLFLSIGRSGLRTRVGAEMTVRR